MRDLKLEDYLDGLFRYAVTLSHDRTAAEDLVQETYVRAIPAIPKLKSNSNVKSWLFTILRNIWLNQLRQRRARSPVSDVIGISAEPRQSVERGPYNSHVSQTECQQVRAAIEELPVHFREVVTLREFEDLSYEDIARVLSCPIGTVMSRLARARAQLRDILSRSKLFTDKRINAGHAE